MTVLAGVLITLAVVGGFLALDRSVLHWYVETVPTPVPPPTLAPTLAPTRVPTPVPTLVPEPAYTLFDVIDLTQSQVSDAGNFPAGTNWVRCLSATYRSGNRMWVVGCEFLVNRDDTNQAAFKLYSFDDRTGRIVR